jgi:serine/threonine protein kinase
MMDAVVKVVCPKCAAAAPGAPGPTPGVCPHCGHPLVAPSSSEPPVAAPAPTACSAEPVDAADEALVADLRAAFGFDGLGPEPVGEGSSAGGPSATRALGLALRAAVLPPGTRLGDFELLAEIGRGGMGIVYRARQLSLNREVALKVLPDCTRHGHLAVQRFLAEAQAAARLHHSNIVPVYAQGTQGQHYYYAMELIDGVALDVVIRSRPELLGSSTRVATSSGLRLKSGAVTPAPSDVPRWLRMPSRRQGSSASAGAPGPLSGSGSGQTLNEVATERSGAAPCFSLHDYAHMARLFSEVADALHYAHQNGTVHRDIKPHNLLLGRDDRLHLTDFGLARLMDQPHLTVSGEIMGTPAYMSPEQVRGDREVDHRTDIYSLGVTLYEVLTGQKPFSGQTRAQIVDAICTREPVPPRRLNPGVPIDLETVCLRAMEKDPQRRYPTAAELAEDLRRFAEGRPIRARRVSWLGRALRWARRHKAVTTAGLSVGAVIVLAAALLWSYVQNRAREADRLLTEAYERLVFVDYRNPDIVRGTLQRAALLGADPFRLALAEALACMGANDPHGALRNLDRAAHYAPQDTRLGYLRAWALWRTDQHADAHAVVEQTDARGGPDCAEAWFFRGLALHFGDPDAAIESYRRACDLRAQQRNFYPQAMLHLARAQNQRLYARRELDQFGEVTASLEQLVRHKLYGAYPYYLLSIAHRLAAEVHHGGAGTRADNSAASRHYELALEWARRGQALDPADDRPIVAEAECLESMGSLAEAIVARTRALAITNADVKRWENLHYRWRLHYWRGELDAARQDLAACASYDPNSFFYRHLYPALIDAEQGAMEAALAHVRAIADEHPGAATAVLWNATGLRLLGRADEAAALLSERVDRVDFGAGLVPPQSPAWMEALYRAMLSDGHVDALLAMAAERPTSWKLWGEAYFHAAARALAAGDRARALEYLDRAYRSFDDDRRYTYHAKLLYVRMRESASWPPWIVLSSTSAPAEPHSGRAAVQVSSDEGAEEGS